MTAAKRQMLKDVYIVPDVGCHWDPSQVGNIEGREAFDPAAAFLQRGGAEDNFLGRGGGTEKTPPVSVLPPRSKVIQT